MESHLSSSWKKLLLERKKLTVKLLCLKCDRLNVKELNNDLIMLCDTGNSANAVPH